MDSSAILRLQYESQHFGFHPRTFLDMVYNVFFENLSTGLNQMKQFMIQRFSDMQPPNVIQSKTDSILKKLVKICDKSIDKLEVYLNANVFSIPNHIVLPEDRIHIINPCTKEDDENVDKEIEDLKNRVLEETAKHFSLRKEIKEQKQIIQHLYSLKMVLENLKNVANQEDVKKEDIELFFADLSQLSELDSKISP